MCSSCRVIRRSVPLGEGRHGGRALYDRVGGATGRPANVHDDTQRFARRRTTLGSSRTQITAPPGCSYGTGRVSLRALRTTQA